MRPQRETPWSRHCASSSASLEERAPERCRQRVEPLELGPRGRRAFEEARKTPLPVLGRSEKLVARTPGTSPSRLGRRGFGRRRFSRYSLLGSLSNQRGGRQSDARPTARAPLRFSTSSLDGQDGGRREACISVAKRHACVDRVDAGVRAETCERREQIRSWTPMGAVSSPRVK